MGLAEIGSLGSGGFVHILQDLLIRAKTVSSALSIPRLAYLLGRERSSADKYSLEIAASAKMYPTPVGIP
ncbi:hypothetical protein [Desulfosporosinus hippei]|uniref:hypothetical protein n=1 Tax=Desulfosporosinus hippei TaxID=569859 RepID=UPI0015A4065F|nr:hypothetical protein [Desulfosporosinus hippei]